MTTSTPTAMVTRASLDEQVSVASGVANALIGPSADSSSTLSNAAALGAAAFSHESGAVSSTSAAQAR